MHREEENQPDGSEDGLAFNAPPTSAGSVAGMIGTRNLKIAIITMPFVFMAVVAVIIAVFGRPGRADTVREPTVPSLSSLSVDNAAGVGLPAGAEIGSIAFDGDRLAIHVKARDGAMILIYDLQANAVVKRIPVSEAE